MQHPSMSLQEIGAAVSILLGFAPSSTLSAVGASKLNDILVPNPFNRPRAVFLLEVNGFNDLKQILQYNEMFSNAVRSTDILDSDKVDIQFADEADVSVVPLDELLEDYTENEISDFASLMGGSYAPDTLEPLNGVLTVPLANGAMVNLHMSKKSEREFVVGLLSLIRNVKGAIQMHQDLIESKLSPAELLMGCFSGIKVLQEHYGDESIVQNGVELLLATLTKIIDSLQEAYKGQIVGVVYFRSTTTQESGKKLDVMFTSPQAARLLGEETVGNATIAKLAEVALVRRTLAWITGIILLLSTLIGIYYLLNMPLTRDTLLYSNVKLD
ncbi:putative membrane protein type I [Senna tora]|uniref:Putative membrane protein type I n=1 Tax=Senna tora TaxID=362788 RepID=A0A835CJL3_9FABA|nr:putative membrane protein type I [Senna tora]